MHQLERTIDLDVSVEDLWWFISNPANLDCLTPGDLKFEILSKPPEKMFDGLIIEYKIAIALLGKQRWVTEIKHVCEQRSFVDEQRFGPYKFWYHYHEIMPLTARRTRMVDRVYYRLPFGPLGLVVEQLWVRGKLTEIFDYRAKTLLKLFPEQPA